MELIANSKPSENKEVVSVVPAFGMVSRELTFRDRFLIRNACYGLLGKEGNGDHKMMSKIARLKKILAFDEMEEYFEMIEENYEDNARKWAREKNYYNAFEAVMAGAMSRDEFLKKFPGADLEKSPEKPPHKIPQPKSDEIRGKARTFQIPPKIDVFISDAIAIMHWDNAAEAEYVTELCETYSLPLDD